MSSQPITGIRFGPFFLETAGRRLMLEGRRIPVGPLELKLLETLLRNRERVLTGDELRILVWADDPSQQVLPAQDVNALYVAIRKLRSALGNYGKWIVNIPKVGYTVAEEAIVEETKAESADVPEHLVRFVGRKAEIARARELLTKTRLLTLTGPPGIGKSRLANHVQSEIAKSYPHGVYLVDFVPIEDDVFVPKTILTALGLVEQPNRPAEDELREYLKDKHLLLLLDNCEHVIEACSVIVESLLRASRTLQVIVTSREALRIPGESILTIPPLSVPVDENVSDDKDLTGYEAVQLFVELAEKHSPGLELGTRDVNAAAQLCRQLEGIPVAIELAAVQVDAYTVEQILAMMGDRFRLLRRRGGETSRHQTLEGAIDWSYGLLTNEEKTLLRRLSVFVGGWTDDTAQEVCGGDGVDKRDVVHLLGRLVRASLIQLDRRKGRHRYRMLEMIRHFSRERLTDAGEEEQFRNRHSRAFLSLAEKAFEEGEKGDWPELLEAEYDNLRAVLRHNIDEGGEIEIGLRLCGALVRFWFNHGHINEASRWTKRALELDDRKSPSARAHALKAAGFFFGQMAGSDGDSERGRASFEESVDIWRRLEDERQLALTLTSYAFLLNRLGDFDKAIEAAEESITIFRRRDEPADIARAANNLALTLLDSGQVQKSLPLFEECLAAARRAEDVFLEAVCLHNLADAATQSRMLDRADHYITESLALFEPLGHRPLVARTLLLRGEVAALRNEFDDALKIQRAALKELNEIGDSQGVATAMEAIACTLSFSPARARMALTLFDAAAGLRAKIKLPLGPARQEIVDTCIECARRKVGKKAASVPSQLGHTISMNESIELALSE